MGIVARVAVKRNKQRYYLRQLIVSKLKLKIENFKIFNICSKSNKYSERAHKIVFFLINLVPHIYVASTLIFFNRKNKLRLNGDLSA